MGVRNTANDGKVALIDSTEGVAFGPIFDSEAEADDFIEYAEQYYGVDDVRTVPPAKLREIHEAFVAAQAADDDE